MEIWPSQSNYCVKSHEKRWNRLHRNQQMQTAKLRMTRGTAASWPDQSMLYNIKFSTFPSFMLMSIERSVVKHVKSKRVFDLPERLHKKWEDMMVKRLVKTMIALKQFDLEQIAIQIKPEKDRQAYNEAKKRAIEEQFKRVQHEISEIRARLIPPKDVDQEAERLNFITTNVNKMLSIVSDGFEYNSIESELEQKVCYCRIVDNILLFTS